jgi:hypothetical protein
MNTTSCKVAPPASGTTCNHYKANRCTNPLALPLYGDRPSAGVCRICPHYRGIPRGLGDVIETAARWLGVKRAVKTVERVTGKECGCAERRRALNEKYPTSVKAGIDETPKQA